MKPMSGRLREPVPVDTAEHPALAEAPGIYVLEP
jgi:hypothetical protein